MRGGALNSPHAGGFAWLPPLLAPSCLPEAEALANFGEKRASAGETCSRRRPAARPAKGVIHVVLAEGRLPPSSLSRPAHAPLRGWGGRGALPSGLPLPSSRPREGRREPGYDEARPEVRLGRSAATAGKAAAGASAAMAVNEEETRARGGPLVL